VPWGTLPRQSTLSKRPRFPRLYAPDLRADGYYSPWTYTGIGASRLRDPIVPTAAVGGASSSAPYTMATSSLDTELTVAFPAWKRCLDVAVAIPLLACSIPILAATAVANRLSGDVGPLFHRAVRMGELGRPFQALKLRTMRTNIAGSAVTAAGDARITPVGRFLRNTKLDELPQLWNVLRGQMTLVGPRPEDPRFVDWSNPLHRAVFSARPGITGPAQIQFRHEEELLPAGEIERMYVERILPAKLVLDAAYLAHRSLGADLKLLARTLLAVAR
jgi:lipopolysaccharide/colanic/teichoic acid biosynthesis glycosyltransferase